MIIYVIRNKINTKLYVGLTQNPLTKRWSQHLEDSRKPNPPSYISRAMKKYGVENFYVEVLEECSSLKELGEREVHWIKTLDTIKNGYNILPGGLTVTSDSFDHFLNSLSKEEKHAFMHNRSKVRQGIKPFGPHKDKPKTSSFIGVRKTRANTFQCVLRYLGESYLKTFKLEINAAIFYDKLVLNFYGPDAILNFPESRNYSKEELEQAIVFLNTSYIKEGQKYLGVCSEKKFNRWCAVGKVGKKVICSVYRKTEEEAYQAKEEKMKSLGY